MEKAELFLKEFESWLDTQVMINQMAMAESEKEFEKSKDEQARDAFIRYESKLDAYRFLQGKLANYHAGKNFHDLPDELLGKRVY